MPEICVDMRLAGAFGVGRLLRNLLALLVCEKELHFTFLYYIQDQGLIDAFPSVRLIPVKSPPFTLREQLELPFKIPKCDFFWTPFFNIPLLPLRSAKRFVTLMDAYHLRFFSSLSFLKKTYSLLFYKAATYLADKSTTISHFSLEELCRYGINVKNMQVIYPFVNPFFKKIENPDSFLEKYSLPSSFLLTVGSGKEHKNIDNLVEATPDEIPLVIVGSKGNYQKKNIYSLGYVSEEELRAFYSSATACVIPSLYEGFGFPALEAMACGCPVVASDKGSLPEICGSAAFYVNPLDIESIRRGVKRIFLDKELRERLCCEGAANLQRFQPEQTISSYKKLFET